MSVQQTEHIIKLTEHPRAARHIRAAKGWGGLLGFAVVGLLSWRAGVPDFEVGLRALIAGVAGYMIAWAVALQVWRHLAIAELRAAQERARERRERALEARRGAEAGDEPSGPDDAGGRAPGQEAARL